MGSSLRAYFASCSPRSCRGRRCLRPCHADARGVGFGDLQAGILHRLHCRAEPVVHEGIHLPRFLGRHVFLGIESLYCPAEARRESADIEARDGTNAAVAGHDASHALATVLPSGETMPNPVTTTRRLRQAVHLDGRSPLERRFACSAAPWPRWHGRGDQALLRRSLM